MRQISGLKQNVCSTALSGADMSAQAAQRSERENAEKVKISAAR